MKINFTLFKLLLVKSKIQSEFFVQFVPAIDIGGNGLFSSGGICFIGDQGTLGQEFEFFTEIGDRGRILMLIYLVRMHFAMHGRSGGDDVIIKGCTDAKVVSGFDMNRCSDGFMRVIIDDIIRSKPIPEHQIITESQTSQVMSLEVNTGSMYWDD